MFYVLSLMDSSKEHAGTFESKVSGVGNSSDV